MDENLIKLNEAEFALMHARQYLYDTDYVVIKIYEASIKGDDTSQLVSQYAEVLAERERVRESIDAIKKTIEDAKGALRTE